MGRNKNKDIAPFGNFAVFKRGVRDGIPIALGYFAVSFSLGIAAKDAGLSAFQGFVASFLTNASAGEHAAFSLIAEQGTYLGMALVILIANARYLLMSCSLSQKMGENVPLIHRLLIGFDVTDELFAITIARDGVFNPYYTYGAMSVATPCWALGTALGIIIGNALPVRVVSAFGVALYGMFLAVIIPPSRKNKVIASLVAVCFALSFVFAKLPVVSFLSGGTRTIILTVLLSVAAALIFPVKDEKGEDSDV